MLSIILLGSPGAGKGTQAKLITKYFNIPQIATGDMLRNAIIKKSAVGLQAKSIIDQGNLVSDDIVIALVKERILENDCKNGFLFDGFPRTITQADSLTKANILINYVIEINVASDIIIDRLAGRRIHITSGRVYHIKYNPPKIENKDDITQEELIHRDDDNIDAIKHRLAVYKQATMPLINYYQQHNTNTQYIKIDGSQDVEIVYKQIINSITC